HRAPAVARDGPGDSGDQPGDVPGGWLAGRQHDRGRRGLTAANNTTRTTRRGRDSGESPPHVVGQGQESLVASSSASCTVLRAAPLRRLSLLMKSARPRLPSTPGSCRRRPTYDGSLPAASRGFGTSTTSTPGASVSSSRARSGVISEANSALTASECPVK